MSVVDITSKADFDKLLESNPYVALQAHASWCGPCKMISPVFAKAAADSAIPDKYVFAKFDIDDVPDLSQELGIRSIPAFYFFENGDKLNNIVGPTPPLLNKAISEVTAKASA